MQNSTAVQTCCVARNRFIQDLSILSVRTGLNQMLVGVYRLFQQKSYELYFQFPFREKARCNMSIISQWPIES
jgi:hypothetical protein